MHTTLTTQAPLWWGVEMHEEVRRLPRKCCQLYEVKKSDYGGSNRKCRLLDPPAGTKGKQIKSLKTKIKPQLWEISGAQESSHSRGSRPDVHWRNFSESKAFDDNKATTCRSKMQQAKLHDPSPWITAVHFEFDISGFDCTIYQKRAIKLNSKRAS